MLLKDTFFFSYLEVKDGDRPRHGRNTQLWVCRRKVSFTINILLRTEENLLFPVSLELKHQLIQSPLPPPKHMSTKNFMSTCFDLWSYNMCKYQCKIKMQDFLSRFILKTYCQSTATWGQWFLISLEKQWFLSIITVYCNYMWWTCIDSYIGQLCERWLTGVVLQHNQDPQPYFFKYVMKSHT